MNKSAFLLAFLFISVYSFAQEDKTLVKSFDPAGAASINFDFPNKEIKNESWDSETFRIELEIHTNMPEAIVSQLVKAGRYNLEGKMEGNQFVVAAPNIEKTVTIKGTDLEDQIYVHVKTPDLYLLNGGSLSKEVFAGRDGTAKEKAMLAEMKKITNKIQVGSVKIVGKDSKAANKPSLKDLKVAYGDILINGEPIDVE